MLDAFGRAGAEWVIVGMLGWFAAGAFIIRMPNYRLVFWPIIFLAVSWLAGLLIDQIIGLIVREPRPQVTYPESKQLFHSLSNWKSFPSDHAMSAWLIFFLALEFGLPAAFALLPMALWVSWGRVYAGLHYPFDLVGGLAVAALVCVVGYYGLVLFT